MLRIFKTVIGVLILPLAAGFSAAFYKQFGQIDIFFTKGQQYFLGGIIAYCLIQLFLFKPVYLYVLGHESVHAIATWLCGGKVTSFDISSSGGSVGTTKSNWFISLSPYLVPIYAVVLIVLYYLAGGVFKVILPQTYFMFLLGMVLAFHVVMTVDTLKMRQPDLLKVGRLTASVFIYLVNLTIVSGALALLFNGFSFRSFANSAYFSSIGIYRVLFNQLFL